MTHWKELDLFRGLAAIGMVVNHAVIKWCGPELPEEGFAAFAFMLGGFAPSLFFFATGVGSGIATAAQRGGQHRFGFWKKVAIVALADQLNTWQGHVGLGVDFLGFIAFSMLCLEPLRHVRHPVRLAAVVCATVLALRFALAPMLPGLPLDNSTILWLSTLLGTTSTPWLSYPPMPWIALPFAGFVLGALAQRGRLLIERRPGRIALGLSIILVGSGAAVLVLAGIGRTFARYGTMSLGFFVASIFVISAALFLSWAACRVSSGAGLVDAVALGGVAALAVIPCHNLVIQLIGLVLPGAVRAGEVPQLGMALVLAVALVVAMARAVGRVSASLTHGPLDLRLPWVFLGGALLAGVILVIMPLAPATPRVLISAAAQMGLCLLLPLPLTWTKLSTS